MRVVLLLTASLLAAPVRASGIAWEKGDFASALAKAKASGKRVLVDVMASWCSPCLAMDRDVLSRDDVAGKLSAALVAFRVDAEIGEGPALVERFHVVGYPTYLVVDGDGNELDRLFGDATAEVFVETMLAFAKGEGTLGGLEKRYFDGGAFDAKAAAELSRRWSVRGDLARARFFLGEVDRILRTWNSLEADATKTSAKFGPMWKPTVDARRIEALTEKRSAEFWLAKYGLLRGSKEYGEAVKLLTAIHARHAGTAEGNEAQFQLAYAYKGLNDEKGAKTALDAYITENAKDSHAYNAYAWFAFKQGLFREEAVVVARAGLVVNPKDAGLWDTLAELQFSLGKKADAVASSKKAVELEPSDPYLKTQLDKFSK